MPELCDYYLGGIVTKGNVKDCDFDKRKITDNSQKIREFLKK
jgi:hypothetical protein